MGLVRSALGFLVRTPDRSALKTAAGAPPPPDLSAVIRQEQAAAKPATVDKTQAPPAPNMLDYIKEKQ